MLQRTVAKSDSPFLFGGRGCFLLGAQGRGFCVFGIDDSMADGLSVPTVGDGAGFCVFPVDGSVDDGLSVPPAGRFLCGQKVTKEPLKGGGISYFPPPLRNPPP